MGGAQSEHRLSYLSQPRRAGHPRDCGVRLRVGRDPVAASPAELLLGRDDTERHA